MEYLVTGGAGFIGSNLVEELLRQENKVVVIDDFSLGKEKNLPKDKHLTVYKKSITDDLLPIMKKHQIAAVFHLAALPRVQFSIKQPWETHTVNIDGTLKMLIACRDAGIKRFVFSSSSSVYGDQTRLPLTEEMTPNPMSPYALHKLVGEQYCFLFTRLFGMETIALRYFNVYGKRQDPAGEYACLIPRFIKMIHEGKQPTIFGDGLQSRDFTHVSDVARANIAAATASRKECFGQAFNIGAGNNVSVNEVTKDIQKILEKKIEPIHAPPVIEPKHTRASIKKSKELLGWEPKIVFEEGLRQTVEYILSL
ncbi:NAD-dependent epimerase/dehydratase family protein [Candidatus Woesearchaeota archaeon]|nr:NAD-dependent epimerase/dehydratase family protein [Candidatus Woesearchaeota archaeon]HIH39023.1 NAD-dependent epimerase/dehydratase family protein [Candidatus Woesearchaeota archaeon]HIH49655.1 NAD-dependent epimerase/dehydratase family protein [Candidatus Woesearchaeota archaeon]HIJ04210.1 NAD-dependent epimerase/dehydratase family protein [Candidatus Woesearchaeota archaeon]